MEQRRLRLGDILDDYCPRERRVTNHAVVAMIEEDVKQTRCTTCDAEHVYKGAKEPRRRSRKDSPAGLFREVLAGMPDVDVPPPVIAAAVESRNDDLRSEDEVRAAAMAEAELLSVVRDEAPVAVAEELADEPESSEERPEDGPFHRRLIRAQLPRIEGQKEARQEPDFTIRSAGNGRGHFRARGLGGQPAGNGHGAGARPHGRRFAGGGNPGVPGQRGPSAGAGRAGGGRGPGGAGRNGRPGFGGPPSGPNRGPRKRSR